MTFNYDIFPERRTIVARYTGLFTLGELTAAAQLLWSDPRYVRSYDGLVDISHGSVAVAMRDVPPLMRFFREHGNTSEGRWAAVASAPLTTAWALVYRRALGARHPLEIFSTWEAACAFLGVDLRPDLPLVGGDGWAVVR